MDLTSFPLSSRRSTIEGMSYKVSYHVGETIDLSTKAASGRLSLEGGHLTIVEPCLLASFGLISLVSL